MSQSMTYVTCLCNCWGHAVYNVVSLLTMILWDMTQTTKHPSCSLQPKEPGQNVKLKILTWRIWFQSINFIIHNRDLHQQEPLSFIGNCSETCFYHLLQSDKTDNNSPLVKFIDAWHQIWKLHGICFWMWNIHLYLGLFEISVNFVPMHPTDNNLGLVWVMAWYWQAITWNNVDQDPWHHTVAVGHKKSKYNFNRTEVQ